MGSIQNKRQNIQTVQSTSSCFGFVMRREFLKGSIFFRNVLVQYKNWITFWCYVSGIVMCHKFL